MTSHAKKIQKLKDQAAKVRSAARACGAEVSEPEDDDAKDKEAKDKAACDKETEEKDADGHSDEPTQGCVATVTLLVCQVHETGVLLLRAAADGGAHVADL